MRLVNWPPAIQRKVLKGAEPIVVRPGSLFEPADLEAERAAAAEKIGHAPEHVLLEFAGAAVGEHHAPHHLDDAPAPVRRWNHGGSFVRVACRNA